MACWMNATWRAHGVHAVGFVCNLERPDQPSAAVESEALNAMCIREVALHELTHIDALHPTNHPYDECDKEYRSQNAAADVHKDLR
jgi:hypothetical protein